MKLFFSTILLFSVFIVKAETPLEALIRKAESTNIPFQTVSFYQPAVQQNKIADANAKEYSLYEIPDAQLQQLSAAKPRNLQITVSLTGQSYTMKLTRVTIQSSGYKLSTSGENRAHTSNSQAVFYQGIVAGIPNSLAAISVFENDIVGVFSTPEKGNFILGKIGEENSTEYVLYNDANLKIENSFHCKTEDDNYIPETHKIGSSREARANEERSCRSILMYYEGNYKLYQAKQSNVTNVENFINGMFNAISTIYYNEYVNVKIDEIYVWTTQDDYSDTDAGDALDLFGNLRASSMHGRLGQLLASGSGSLGGLAWLDVLCSNSLPVSFVGIGNTYSNFPTYSWNIEAMAHETGHNIASPHTHNCWAWAGGPIDGCGQASGNSDGGSCTGPIPTKGTIMSYCHLLSGVGISLALGFGPQPGDLIREAFWNATCVTEQEPFESLLSVDTTQACLGDFIYMEVNPFDDVYFYYDWYRGNQLVSDITNSFQATQSGTYYCVTTDSNGCTAASNAVELTFIAPDAQIETSPEPLCNSESAELSAVAGNLLYVWNTGDSTQNITITQTGTYILTVMDTLSGCSASTNKTIDESLCAQSGIAETKIADLHLYPNPTNAGLIVESSVFVAEKVKVLVYDVTGILLSVEVQAQGEKIVLSTNTLASGVYVLHLNVNGQIINQRFVKF